MRLPFMQLESDLVAHGASTVARLAGCSVPQALGHIAILRAWAVSRATDEAPPDGFVPGDAAPRLVEAAAGWEGEKGALLQALLDAGQVAREETGLRVLHLNPYVTAWERNAKAKARMANARERSQNMRVTDGERSAKFGGQTQTQTQKETSASQGAADASPLEDLPDATDDAQPADPPPPAANGCPDCTTITACWKHLERPKPGAKLPRTPSKAEVLYGKIQDHRRKRCESAGEAYVEDRWEVQRINREMGAVVKGTDEDRERFEDAFSEYLADDARAQQGWALSYFMKGGVRSMYEKRALDAKRGAA